MKQPTLPDPPTSELIRYYRKDRGLTQKQLADMLGTTPDYISDVECGKKPHITLVWLQKCAEIFGVKVRDLIPREL